MREYEALNLKSEKRKVKSEKCLPDEIVSHFTLHTSRFTY